MLREFKFIFKLIFHARKALLKLSQKLRFQNCVKSEKMATRSNVAEKKVEIGIFWDIENCQVPYGKSASELVQTIRRYLELEHPECRYAYDFVAACDVFRLRETQRITDQLNKVGVDVLHVNGMLKNAADDKLKECIEKFADRHGEDARLVLISGDADFAPAVRAARRKGEIVGLKII